MVTSHGQDKVECYNSIGKSIKDKQPAYITFSVSTTKLWRNLHHFRAWPQNMNEVCFLRSWIDKSFATQIIKRSCSRVSKDWTISFLCCPRICGHPDLVQSRFLCVRASTPIANGAYTSSIMTLISLRSVLVYFMQESRPIYGTLFWESIWENSSSLSAVEMDCNYIFCCKYGLYACWYSSSFMADVMVDTEEAHDWIVRGSFHSCNLKYFQFLDEFPTIASRLQHSNRLSDVAISWFRNSISSMNREHAMPPSRTLSSLKEN